MRFMLLSATLTLAACSAPREPLVRHPRSYADRMAAADEHSQRAEQERRAASVPDTDPMSSGRYQCGDVALSDQSTSGGERLVQSIPCWDISEESASRHQRNAEREQVLADANRRLAAELAGNELAACKGLPARSIERSPFSYRRNIAEVIPHRDAGTLRGVRIVYKPVPGLTAGWMRQVIACRKARFERLGEPATYYPEDPTLVAHSEATVYERRTHLEVVVRSPDDVGAHVALERARDLVRIRTATRD